MGYLKIIIIKQDFKIFLSSIYYQIVELKSLLKITMIICLRFMLNLVMRILQKKFYNILWILAIQYKFFFMGMGTIL